MTTLERASFLSNERWLQTLPADPAPVTFSKAHEQKMRILFDKMRHNRYHRFTRRMTAALIAAILILSMLITAFAVPAVREFTKTILDGSVVVSVPGASSVKVTPMTLNYIPDGFELTEEVQNDAIIYVTYQYGNKWFKVSKEPLKSDITFDSEHIIIEEYEFNDLKYLHILDNTENSFLWNDGAFTYYLESNFSSEEIIKIAENIQ